MAIDCTKLQKGQIGITTINAEVVFLGMDKKKKFAFWAPTDVEYFNARAIDYIALFRTNKNGVSASPGMSVEALISPWRPMETAPTNTQIIVICNGVIHQLKRVKAWNRMAYSKLFGWYWEAAPPTLIGECQGWMPIPEAQDWKEKTK